jgi:uncharacterized protein (TIGR02246 family)
MMRTRRLPDSLLPMPRRKSQLFPTPEDAENAFYEAFERADLAAMMAVWAEDDDVVCVHPQGPRLIGFEAVRESWTQIFASGMQLRVRATEERRFLGQSLAVHAVVEILAAAGESESSPPVAATNVYVLTEAGWRMLVHHASPLPGPATEAPEPEPHTLH